MEQTNTKRQILSLQHNHNRHHWTALVRQQHRTATEWHSQLYKAREGIKDPSWQGSKGVVAQIPAQEATHRSDGHSTHAKADQIASEDANNNTRHCGTRIQPQLHTQRRKKDRTRSTPHPQSAAQVKRYCMTTAHDATYQTRVSKAQR